MSEIIIKNSKMIGRKLTSRFTVSKHIKKYFKPNTFFIIYDEAIYANKSILNIPLLSSILPLAWLTGTNIIVNELDESYKLAMDKLKQVFKKMYPKAPFTTKIIVNKLVKNKINIQNTGLFFSGGVDSMYSLIQNIALKPRLIMIWGLEGYPYPVYQKYHEMIFKIYSEFSERQGLILNHIKTNVSDILNILRIEHDFHKFLYDGSFWARLQHSSLIGFAAPLSINRFDKLIISASHDQTFPYYKYPYASQPSTDEKISWANLKVRHFGYIHRVNKIMGPIKKYVNNHDKLILRVCFAPQARDKINCSSCEKCFRTIVPLVLAGINPYDCGFQVDNLTFKLMKSMFKHKKVEGWLLEVEWKLIQKEISDKIEVDIHGAKEFFKWFKGYNLKHAEKKVWLYRNIYNKLPYSLARLILILFNKIGIDIQEHCPIHPELEKRGDTYIFKSIEDRDI